MVRVRALVQFTFIAAAPFALWLSAPMAMVRGVDLQGSDAARLEPYLRAVDGRIVQLTPDGSTILASGPPAAMAAALLRAGALPVPLPDMGNTCGSRTARRA